MLNQPATYNVGMDTTSCNSHINYNNSLTLTSENVNFNTNGTATTSKYITNKIFLSDSTSKTCNPQYYSYVENPQIPGTWTVSGNQLIITFVFSVGHAGYDTIVEKYNTVYISPNEFKVSCANCAFFAINLSGGAVSQGIGGEDDVTFERQ